MVLQVAAFSGSSAKRSTLEEDGPRIFAVPGTSIWRQFSTSCCGY